MFVIDLRTCSTSAEFGNAKVIASHYMNHSIAVERCHLQTNDKISSGGSPNQGAH